MHLTFDQHHLLCVENPNIPQLKEYRFSLSGYQISSYDKAILAYHKRQRKLMNLKNLGEGMQVCYLQDQPLPEYKLNISMLERTLAMFSWFNEETGETYRFLPFFSKDTEKLQKESSEMFWINCTISKESQGVIIRWLTKRWEAPQSDEEILSFLFALIRMYGHLEHKDWQVFSAKAHIPLFSIRNNLEQLFAECFSRLQSLGLFATFGTIAQGRKTTFQFSTNDAELLRLFVQWWNEKKPDSHFSLENFEQKQLEIKDQLLDFITSEECSWIQGKDAVLNQLKTHRLKFIKY